MLHRLEASQITKVAIFCAICFVVALVFFNTGEDLPKSEKLESPIMLPKVGGLSGVRGEVTREVIELVEKIKPILEEKTKTKYEYLDAIAYKNQVVAGMNFFVKAKAKPVDGEEKIVHLRIYRNLKQDVELTSYELDKTKDEELKYFS